MRVGGETVGLAVICTAWCVWCGGWDWCMVKLHGRVPGQWQGGGGDGAVGLAVICSAWCVWCGGWE